MLIGWEKEGHFFQGLIMVIHILGRRDFDEKMVESNRSFEYDFSHDSRNISNSSTSSKI